MSEASSARRRKIGEPISDEHVQMAFFKNINSKLEILLKHHYSQTSTEESSVPTVSADEHNKLREKLDYIMKTNKQLTGAIRLLKTNFVRIDEENRAFAEDN